MQNAANKVSWVETSLNFGHSWQFRFPDTIHLKQQCCTHCRGNERIGLMIFFSYAERIAKPSVKPFNINILEVLIFTEQLLMQLSCPKCSRTAFSQRIKKWPWGYYYSDKNVACSTLHQIQSVTLTTIDLSGALPDNAQSQCVRQISRPLRH